MRQLIRWLAKQNPLRAAWVTSDLRARCAAFYWPSPAQAGVQLGKAGDARCGSLPLPSQLSFFLKHPGFQALYVELQAGIQQA